MDTLSGEQEMTVVSEAGLYSIILRSRKQEAKTFKHWVTHKVGAAHLAFAIWGIYEWRRKSSSAWGLAMEAAEPLTVPWRIRRSPSGSRSF